MARRNNPLATFAMFLGLVGFGYASYHFIYVEKVFGQETKETPPLEEMDKIRLAIEDALGTDECFGTMSSFNWRDQSKRYRMDVAMHEGCGMTEAKRLAKRVSEIVQRASSGNYEAEVSLNVLGRVVWHYVP